MKLWAVQLSIALSSHTSWVLRHCRALHFSKDKNYSWMIVAPSWENRESFVDLFLGDSGVNTSSHDWFLIHFSCILKVFYFTVFDACILHHDVRPFMGKVLGGGLSILFSVANFGSQVFELSALPVGVCCGKRALYEWWCSCHCHHCRCRTPCPQWKNTISAIQLFFSKLLSLKIFTLLLLYFCISGCNLEYFLETGQFIFPM